MWTSQCRIQCTDWWFVCQLLFHFASTDLLRLTVISLPSCLTHRLPTLHRAMKARDCIRQCHPIRRSSQVAITRNNNHLSLPARHIKRPLLTIHLLSNSNNLSSWSLLKLRWSWRRRNLFSPSLDTSSCHASSHGAAASSVDSLPSSWPVSVTVFFINSTAVTYYTFEIQKKTKHYRHSSMSPKAGRNRGKASSTATWV